MKKKKEVQINTDYITLGQFLKFAGVISNGGEAKIFIAENKIIVNTELTSARGKKLYPGDQISINDSEFFEIAK